MKSKNSMRKSREVPLGVYKKQQARISRHKLYKTSAFYTTYAVIVLAFALRSPHPLVALIFYVLGMASYTLVEYLTHRWLFHYQFEDKPGLDHYLYKIFDSKHNGHHNNPLDGNHINGGLGDLLPLFVVAAPLSFVAPLYTLPVMLAGNVQGYIVTEWIHHCMHFYRFRDPYFRYVRRHHFYHHSPRGAGRGYGVTNGFWDIPFRSRYPAEVRWALHRRAKQKVKG
jgi:hypothetical protein